MGIVIDRYVVGPRRAPKIVNGLTWVVADIDGTETVISPKTRDGPETPIPDGIVAGPIV